MKTRPSLAGVAQSVDDLAEVIAAFATNVDQRFATIEHRLDRIESTMATKTYVDYKLADLKGDLQLMLKQHSHA